MSFYLINKTIRDGSGIVISKHDDFGSAKQADSELQRRTESKYGRGAYVPMVIIESKNDLKPGAVVTPSDY